MPLYSATNLDSDGDGKVKLVSKSLTGEAGKVYPKGSTIMRCPDAPIVHADRPYCYVGQGEACPVVAPPPSPPQSPTSNVHANGTDGFIWTNRLSAAFNDSGTIGGYTLPPEGFKIDKAHGVKRPGLTIDDWHDVILGGTPVEMSVISHDDVRFRNAKPLGTVEIPGGAPRVDGGALVWDGVTASGLKVRQRVTLDGALLRFDLALTNTSGAILRDVRYLRTLDPDQGDKTFVTTNEVTASGTVTATAQGRVLTLGSADPRARASTWGFRNYEPRNIPAQPVGTKRTADEAINLLFEPGDIAPGQTAVFNFVLGRVA